MLILFFLWLFVFFDGLLELCEGSWLLLKSEPWCLRLRLLRYLTLRLQVLSHIDAIVDSVWKWRWDSIVKSIRKRRGLHVFVGVEISSGHDVSHVSYLNHVVLLVVVISYVRYLNHIVLWVIIIWIHVWLRVIAMVRNWITLTMILIIFTP